MATTDGGKNWEDVSDRLDNEDQFHLNAIAAVKDAGLFIVGEQGSMFRSADWGHEPGKNSEGPYEGSLFGVIGTAQPNTLLAYGLRGNLYRSTDFGSNWDKVELKAERGDLEFGLSGGTLLDDGSIVIVGNGGSVISSSDNGENLQRLQPSGSYLALFGRRGGERQSDSGWTGAAFAPLRQMALSWANEPVNNKKA